MAIHVINIRVRVMGLFGFKKFQQPSKYIIKIAPELKPEPSKEINPTADKGTTRSSPNKYLKLNSSSALGCANLS